jgi:hypothetical protein
MMKAEERHPLIETIRDFVGRLETAVCHLTPTQLTTHYLPHEWTVAQNVHHLADSHMNSFIRLKLILTEENPPVKPYDQDAWADKPDSNNPDIQTSLMLLRGLHTRWALLFTSLTEADWQRTGIHPDIGTITPEDLLQIYADHCEAHLDQIARTLAPQIT